MDTDIQAPGMQQTPDIVEHHDGLDQRSPVAPGRRSRIGRVLPLIVQRGYPIALVLAAWEAASRLEIVDPFFVPSFTTVLGVWFDAVFVSGSLWPHITASLFRAVTGLALAVVGGVVVGLVMGRVRAVANFVDPLVAAIFPMPKLALYPLLILFLGIGESSKIALIFLAAFFPVLINTYAGVRSVNKFLIWNALTKGASSLQIMRRVILPGALPQMFSGFRVASSMAFLLIVASEMIAANEGLGFLIMYSQRTFRPDMMFAGVLTIAVLGFAVDRSINLAGHRLLKWQDTA